MEQPAKDLFGHAQPLEYPDAPGHRRIATSIEAAEAMAPQIGRLQRYAFEVIAERAAYGATTDELAAFLELDRWSIQPRTSELRRNATGKRAIVWCLPKYKPDEANG